MHSGDKSIHSEDYNMIDQDSHQPGELNGPPPLPLDLHDHKSHICLQWGIILFTSCVAPLVLYPSLHWGANLSDKIGLFPKIPFFYHAN